MASVLKDMLIFVLCNVTGLGGGKVHKGVLICFLCNLSVVDSGKGS